MQTHECLICPKREHITVFWKYILVFMCASLQSCVFSSDGSSRLWITVCLHKCNASILSLSDIYLCSNHGYLIQLWRICSVRHLLYSDPRTDLNAHTGSDLRTEALRLCHYITSKWNGFNVELYGVENLHWLQCKNCFGFNSVFIISIHMNLSTCLVV